MSVWLIRAQKGIISPTQTSKNSFTTLKLLKQLNYVVYGCAQEVSLLISKLFYIDCTNLHKWFL